YRDTRQPPAQIPYESPRYSGLPAPDERRNKQQPSGKTQFHPAQLRVGAPPRSRSNETSPCRLLGGDRGSTSRNLVRRQRRPSPATRDPRALISAARRKPRQTSNSETV